MLDKSMSMARDNCVLDNELFNKYFVQDLEQCLNVIGRLDNYHSMHNIEYSSFDIAVKIGSEAIKIIEDTSYKNWNETVDDKLAIWQRLVWRFCLTVFMGYIIEEHHINYGKANWSWDPGRENIGRDNLYDIRIKPSGRQINAELTNVATYLRLFTDSYSFSGAMQGQAMIDAFDASGSRVNPIRSAFKRAAKKGMNSIKLDAVPMWWKRCLYDFGVELTNTSNKSDSLGSDHLTAKEGNEVNSLTEVGSRVNNTKDSAVIQSVPVQYNKTIKTFFKLIETDSVNSKGCLIIKYDDEVWVKYPKIIVDISKITGDSEAKIREELQEVIDSTNNEKGFRFKIEPEGKVVGSMSLARLRKDNEHIRLVLNSNHNNSDIRLDSKND